jgi:plasmid stabilization system protein ParE
MDVIWLKPAAEHLESIFKWYASKSERAAIKINNQLWETADTLKISPYMGVLESYLTDDSHRAYRSLVVGKLFKIVYYVNQDSEKIFILAIWDCRRNPADMHKYVFGED